MREYEVMHIQSPSTTNLIPSINNRQEEDDPEELIEFDLHRYGGPPLSPLTTTTTTVIIREKRSFLHRLSQNLTITRFLGFTTNDNNSSGGGPGTRVRQGPDMKLKQRWILLIFILTSILLILLFSSVKFKTLKLASHQLGVTLDLEELTDRHKCPACFGVNLCPAIFKEQIELNDWNKFAMSRLVNVKNIFYATWTDEKGVERQVVLKKLAHNNELDELDKSICDRHHGTGAHVKCDVSDTVVDLIEKYKIEKQDPGRGIILHGERIGSGGSDLLLCPSHRKMDFIVEAARKALRGQHHDTILANVFTMLLLNPEPLLLNAFPQSEGWPFPKYYGACGRIIAEEYVGRRLTSFLNEPFPVRASLAKQLLEMANKFYDNPTNFILYLTDMTPDNFAVDEDTLTVRAIDLGNFIMVDKEDLSRNTNPDSDKLLESESMPCEPEGHAHAERPCFSFSTEDLCVRPHTDHNHYAVCAGLLAPGAIADEFPLGLLHSIPPDFLSNPKLKTFQDVLLKCKDPKLGNPNWHYTRVEAADELIHQLDIYLKTQQAAQGQ